MSYLNSISLKDQIYASVLENIIQGEFSTEDTINEKQLIEKFQVSRAPVREALIALCNESILYSIPYVGYKVTPLSEEDIAKAREYRCVLECGFMDAYWEQLNETALEKLEALYEAQHKDKTPKDSYSHWEENIIFHQTFFDIYNNNLAYQDLRSAMSLQTRAYAQARWDQLHTHTYVETSDYHKLILEAIRNDQKDEAIRLLKSDILSL